MDVKAKLLEGNKRAAARIITWIESGDPRGYECLKDLYAHTGHAYVIGITGPPGAGKSTLTDQLVKRIRKTGKKVSIIAVDPTSPFTGGAILGDRIRMNDLTSDAGVFIRSMGARGYLGGISEATAPAIKVLDMMGSDVIIVETVGVGQSEIDIVKHADTTVMVTVPGLGDDIQTIKAGIMEIGDVFVVNKADRDGAKRTVLELEAMLDFNGESPWRPPVLQAIAQQGKGIEVLIEAIEKHEQFLRESGVFEAHRRRNIKSEILELIKKAVMIRVNDHSETEQMLDAYVDQIAAHEQNPFTAAEQIMAHIQFK